MKEIEIKSFKDLVNTLDFLKKKSNLIFRGQSDLSWSVLPKSGREEYTKNYSVTFNDIEVFSSWKRYAKFHIDKSPENDWDWLAIAQHHGLATRLIDWSKNPLVAAYFACFENNLKDGVIYYYEIHSSDLLYVEQEKTSPFKFKGFRVFFPSGLASRIINQRGLFTISDKPEIGLENQLKNSLKKIVISSSAKNDIIQSLDFLGINKLSLYQDLDSLSGYLNDYVISLGQNRRNQELDILLTND